MYYDEGWNARVKGEAFDRTKSIDWKDGWKDCNELEDEERKKIGEI